MNASASNFDYKIILCTKYAPDITDRVRVSFVVKVKSGVLGLPLLYRYAWF